MVIVLRIISAFPLRAILMLSGLAWRAIFALPGYACRDISAIPARATIVITALPAGVHNVISWLVQERFRDMEFFLVGVFLSLLCNVILAASIGVFVQTAVIAIILPFITSAVFLGFANDWKQVASMLRANVFEIAIRLFLKLDELLGISNRIRNIFTSSLTTALVGLSVLPSGLFPDLSSLLPSFAGNDLNISSSLASALSSRLIPDFSSILPSYTRSDSNSSSAPERTLIQKAKERLSACIMGVILGSFVHIVITVYSSAWTTSQALLYEYHLSNVIYSACVTLLSIATAVV